MSNLISEIIKFELIREVLSEGRVEDAKAKYPEFENLIDFLVQNDPSGNNKYLMWLLKMWQKTPSGVIDRFQDLSEYIQIFHKNINKFPKKDVNQYLTWTEFKNTVGAVKREIEEREKEKKAEEGAKKIFQSGDWVLVRPLTHEASCKYGAGTKWCTTSKDDTYFKTYTKEDLLTYLIHKPTNSKFAFLYDIADKDLSVFNPPDNDITGSDYEIRVKSLKSFLTKIVEGDMGYFLTAESKPFDHRMAWGIVKPGNMSDYEYGYNEEGFIRRICNMILNKLEEVMPKNINLPKLEEFYNSIDFKIVVDEKALTYSIIDHENDRIDDLGRGELNRFITNYNYLDPLRRYLNRFKSQINTIDWSFLKKVFYSLHNPQEYQIYINKVELPDLKNIFSDLKTFKVNVEKNPEYENVMAQSEATGILKAFNKELSSVKKEIEVKKKNFYSSLNFTPAIKKVIEDCSSSEDRTYFSRCVHSFRISAKTINFEGRRRTLNAVANQESLYSVTDLVIEYMKYNNIPFNFNPND
jgi:hypothetical protein